MNKTIFKVSVAAMLVGQLLTLGGTAQNNRVAAAAATTKTPVMTDNFFKYGMTKTQSLPATVSLNGLTYTLQKAFFYDVKSNDAKILWDKYNFYPVSWYPKAKYLLWTKVTITNKTSKVIRRDMYDLSDKWYITVDNAFNNGATTLLPPGKPKHPVNSTEILKNFILKPNQSITTYEAYLVETQPRYFSVTLQYGNEVKALDLVNDENGEGE